MEARPHGRLGIRDRTQLDTGSTKARIKSGFSLAGLANHLIT
jgi:hypothetical protein